MRSAMSRYNQDSAHTRRAQRSDSNTRPPESYIQRISCPIRRRFYDNLADNLPPPVRASRGQTCVSRPKRKIEYDNESPIKKHQGPFYDRKRGDYDNDISVKKRQASFCDRKRGDYENVSPVKSRQGPFCDRLKKDSNFSMPSSKKDLSPSQRSSAEMSRMGYAPSVMQTKRAIVESIREWERKVREARRQYQYMPGSNAWSGGGSNKSPCSIRRWSDGVRSDGYQSSRGGGPQACVRSPVRNAKSTVSSSKKSSKSIITNKSKTSSNPKSKSTKETSRNKPHTEPRPGKMPYEPSSNTKRVHIQQPNTNQNQHNPSMIIPSLHTQPQYTQPQEYIYNPLNNRFTQYSVEIEKKNVVKKKDTNTKSKGGSPYFHQQMCYRMASNSARDVKATHSRNRYGRPRLKNTASGTSLPDTPTIIIKTKGLKNKMLSKSETIHVDVKPGNIYIPTSKAFRERPHKYTSLLESQTNSDSTASLLIPIFKKISSMLPEPIKMDDGNPLHSKALSMMKIIAKVALQRKVRLTGAVKSFNQCSSALYKRNGDFIKEITKNSKHRQDFGSRIGDGPLDSASYSNISKVTIPDKALKARSSKTESYRAKCKRLLTTAQRNEMIKKRLIVGLHESTTTVQHKPSTSVLTDGVKTPVRSQMSIMNMSEKYCQA